MIDTIFWISVWTAISSIVTLFFIAMSLEILEKNPNRDAPDWLEYVGYGIGFLFSFAIAVLFIYGLTWFITNIVLWILG